MSQENKKMYILETGKPGSDSHVHGVGKALEERGIPVEYIEKFKDEEGLNQWTATLDPKNVTYGFYTADATMVSDLESLNEKGTTFLGTHAYHQDIKVSFEAGKIDYISMPEKLVPQVKAEKQNDVSATTFVPNQAKIDDFKDDYDQFIKRNGPAPKEIKEGHELVVALLPGDLTNSETGVIETYTKEHAAQEAKALAAKLEGKNAVIVVTDGPRTGQRHDADGNVLSKEEYRHHKPGAETNHVFKEFTNILSTEGGFKEGETLFSESFTLPDKTNGIDKKSAMNPYLYMGMKEAEKGNPVIFAIDGGSVSLCGEVAKVIKDMPEKARKNITVELLGYDAAKASPDHLASLETMNSLACVNVLGHPEVQPEQATELSDLKDDSAVVADFIINKMEFAPSSDTQATVSKNQHRPKI